MCLVLFCGKVAMVCCQCWDFLLAAPLCSFECMSSKVESQIEEFVYGAVFI